MKDTAETSVDEFVITAVGDVVLDRPDPASMFKSTGEVLRGADITFGNCETAYAESHHMRNPIARGALQSNPRNLPFLRTEGGFDVMSFANNHHLDFGYEPFLSTIELLEVNGIQCCGAGSDEARARRPAIIDCRGTRVAFLAYSSIMFLGYEADGDKPGAAPMRAYTHYHQVEDEQPGTPPSIVTVPYPQDLAALEADVRLAWESADIVVVSCHWGLHFVRGQIAGYERIVGRAAIDAGADVVLGHHAHILKGVDKYRGKFIFHSLGNFAFDNPRLVAGTLTSPRLQETFDRYPGDIAFHEDYPAYPFAVDARKTMILRMTVREGTLQRISILPCHVEPDNHPRLVSSDEPLFNEIADYMQAVTDEAGLGARFRVSGSEIDVL